MIDDFIFYDYVLSESIINRLINLSKNNTRYGYQCDNVRERSDFPLTLSERTNPKIMVKVYSDFIGEYSAGLRFNNQELFANEAKIAKYIPGDYFDWHTDNMPPSKDRPGRRELSCITYLNDDYIGGETQFKHGKDIIPKKGKTLIFPSNWCFRHRGNIIEEGIKYIYIQHIWA